MGAVRCATACRARRKASGGRAAAAARALDRARQGGEAAGVAPALRLFCERRARGWRARGAAPPDLEACQSAAVCEEQGANRERCALADGGRAPAIARRNVRVHARARQARAQRSPRPCPALPLALPPARASAIPPPFRPVPLPPFLAARLQSSSIRPGRTFSSRRSARCACTTCSSRRSSRS